MGKDPSMPFYVNDWLSSSRVNQMTLEQQGAYLRLLCHCWASQDASLPSDDEALAALSGLGQGWLQNGYPLVKGCFQPHPTKKDKLTNVRVYELWQEREEWRRKSSEGGKKSAAKRWGTKGLGGHKGGVTTLVTKRVTKRQPNGNSSSSSSSSSYKKKIPKESGGSFLEIEQELIAIWNSSPQVVPNRRPRLSEKKRRNLTARLRDKDWWGQAKEAIECFPLPCWGDGKGWDIEWFLRPDTVESILDGRSGGGKYGWSPKANGRFFQLKDDEVDIDLTQSEEEIM